jgi:hypothetical protein
LTQCRARASARAFVRAHVSAILKMEQVRQHSAMYRQALDDLKSGRSQSLPIIFGAEDYVSARRYPGHWKTRSGCWMPT